MSGAYLLGRAEATLKDSPAAVVTQDRLFVAERLEDTTLEAQEFRHCTFANVSFKGTTLRNMRFTDCVFVECYFRKATLESCIFAACRFLESRFPHIQIRSCQFSYTAFRGCCLPFDEILHSLPSAPNERELITLNLAHECERSGDARGARQYRLDAHKAHEQHLWAAVVSKSSWYREHHRGLERAKAGLDLVGRKVNRWVWGYGESFPRLLATLVVLMTLVFPLLFWLWTSAFVLRGAGAIPGPSDLLILSSAVMLRIPSLSAVEPSRGIGYFLVGLESLVSLILVGLFGSYLFRAILRK